MTDSRQEACARIADLIDAYHRLAGLLTAEAERLDDLGLDELLTSEAPPVRRMSPHTLEAEVALDDALDALREGDVG